MYRLLLTYFLVVMQTLIIVFQRRRTFLGSRAIIRIYVDDVAG
jgi:hypothetical protein